MRIGVTAARFDEVIRANDGDLLRYFESRMSNPADAAEAFGELLLTAWRRRRKMPNDDIAARMWLFTTARNVLYNARRSLSRRSEAVSRFTEETRAAIQVDDDDTAHGLRDAIASLPRDDAELIRLVYWDGFSVEETAAILQLNPSTARSRLSRIRRELRTVLEGTAGATDDVSNQKMSASCPAPRTEGINT